MRSTSAATALAVLFGSVALSAVSAGTASAATARVGSPAGFVVDGALQRVFVGDGAAGAIVAADYSGALVDKVSGVSAGSEYFPVGSNGKSAVSLGAAGASGVRARMRSVYVNGSSGGTVNSTTYGSWKYLYFSN